MAAPGRSRASRERRKSRIEAQISVSHSLHVLEIILNAYYRARDRRPPMNIHGRWRAEKQATEKGTRRTRKKISSVFSVQNSVAKIFASVRKIGLLVARIRVKFVEFVARDFRVHRAPLSVARDSSGKHIRKFENNRPVLEIAGFRIALLVVNDEQVAQRAVDDVETDIGAPLPKVAVVLHQSVQEDVG